VVTVSKDLLCQAHKYILNNTDEVQPNINEHMNYIRHIDLSKSKKEKWINIINRSLLVPKSNCWSNDNKSYCISKNLRWLAHRPRINILSYRGCPTNDYYFLYKSTWWQLYYTKQWGYLSNSINAYFQRQR